MLIITNDCGRRASVGESAGQGAVSPVQKNQKPRIPDELEEIPISSSSITHTTMSSSYGSYNSLPPELSNNPFIDHPSNGLARFPDISSPTDPRFTNWNYSPNVAPQQQAYNTYNPPQLAQQQYTSNWGGSPTYQTQGQGIVYPQQTSGGARFQPSSSFGQQLSSALDVGGYIQGGQGYQQQPQQQLTQAYGIPNGYNTGAPGQIQIPVTPYQQAGVTNPGYLSEFDPYSAIGQGALDTQRRSQQPQQQQGGGGLTNGGGSLNPQTDLHPREFIRKHKEELEIWDTYSWKQLLNSLESLKAAWDRRVEELNAAVRQLSTNWGGAAQQELAQYKSVRFLVCLFPCP